MDLKLIPISILLLILALFRIYNLKKPFYLFEYLFKSKEAVVFRVISSLIMLSLAYGLAFKYFWAFFLFIADFSIGLVNHIVLLLIAIYQPKKLKKEIFKSKELAIKLNLFLIIFWILIMIYIFKVYF